MITEEQVQEQVGGRKYPNPVWLLVVAILAVVSFGVVLPEPAALLGMFSYVFICSPESIGALY